MQVSRLTPAHAVAYRAIMLAGYAESPEAFTATVAERELQPLEFWVHRVSDEPEAAEQVLGAFDDDRLVGVAGLKFEMRPKTRHKAWLFGMYVRPEARGQGVARALVEAVVDGARERLGVRVIQLTVTESNGAAIGLYESCGFRRYGVEPMAIKVGERYLGKVHMWRRLDEDES